MNSNWYLFSCNPFMVSETDAGSRDGRNFRSSGCHIFNVAMIAEAKQHWSVVGWVTKNLLSRASPCFGRHVKPLVPAEFAVVTTHGVIWPVLLVCNP
jgi:hypothetical protein